MKNLLSVAEILKETGIARATLYRMIEEGLPYVQVGARKKLFDLNTVQEFITARKNKLASKLNVGEEYSNEELCSIFKCSTQGGMRRSHSMGALVLISHHDDPGNAYMDYWDGDTLYYTGMGMEGDQSIDFAQNKTLRDSENNGIIVYLFEVFSNQKYMYRGIVKLAGPPFQKKEIDFFGNLRLVWKFPLQLINQNLLDEHFIIKEQHTIGLVARTMSNQVLRERALCADGIARSRITETTTYEYNLYVREYANRRARGQCQLCKKNAPFAVNERPFLKTYHLQPLSKGGKDVVENIAALCPNCYERLNQLHLAEDIEAVLKQIEVDEKSFIPSE